MTEPREYRIQIRTNSPMAIADLDEFHALASRLARLSGRDPMDVYLTQQDGEFVAEITTVYTHLTGDSR